MKLWALTLLMLISIPSFACSCSEWSMVDAVTNSKAIFIAKITKSQYANSEPFDGAFKHHGKIIEANYIVTHTVKGPTERKGVIYTTDPNEASCSVGFSEGERYFIYLNGKCSTLDLYNRFQTSLILMTPETHNSTGAISWDQETRSIKSWPGKSTSSIKSNLA